ncbi:MAG: tRNA (adenosine(37)-N6)-dimethylallyltransferase MiaA [Phycisphaerae bacterium]|nr:tRNA (adenosine(37)-N6)-dimethylallyltransferase MiaA [Phycisphaerae bacterium]MDW8263448.1 tRNA (adenosine(37)-N6)-dimethylallyltransferase MiaA [Phycisphaerales bacterium]
MAEPHPIVAIIGPTASGKSELALALAEHLGGEILCVDSMTIYRGMDIGTAKPTPDDRRRVRHHLLDVADPTQTFAVSRFVEMADAVIHDCRTRGRWVVAVGGTPLYFRALFQGIFQGPGADPVLRHRLSDQSNQQLHERLCRIDPVSAGRIHANDRKRMIRAIEVFEQTGRPISSLQTQWSHGAGPRHRARWIGLHWSRSELNRRINLRVRRMIEAGWLDEVRALLHAYGQLGPTASEAAGYAELAAFVQGTTSLEEAIERTKIATRQLARRQMKWFRRFEGVHWLEGSMPPEQLVRESLRLVQATP